MLHAARLQYHIHCHIVWNLGFICICIAPSLELEIYSLKGFLCRLYVAPDLKSYYKVTTYFAFFKILQPAKRRKMTEN